MEATGVNEKSLSRLKIWNISLAVLHGVQAAAILFLGGSFAITVTSQFPQGPPGSPDPAPEPLFAVGIAYAVALFLALAAIDHLLTGTVLRKSYEADLRNGINKYRWIEYSFSSTIMMIVIGFYTGLTGITTVIVVIGANVGMILFGWIQEEMNPPGRTKTTMAPFWFGTIAGITPWIAILVNITGAADMIPGFVYGIVVSLFVFFMSFAVNQWLQYRKIGPWKSYAYGEKGYLVLSLVAKTALAWQIFGGSLNL